MASKIDIWNTALSHLGQKASVTDPDEASAEANHCRRFYSIALSVILEAYAWGFATRRVALAVVTNPVNHWAYAYALPNMCLKARAVLLPESTDDSKEQPFAIESADDGSMILYTNVEDAVLRYTTLVEDTTKFTPYFVMALSYALASLVSGPITKDAKVKKSMLDAATYYTQLAEAADANASASTAYRDFIPQHMVR